MGATTVSMTTPFCVWCAWTCTLGCTWRSLSQVSSFSSCTGHSPPPPLRQHDGLARLVGRLASGIASYLVPCWTYRAAEPGLMGSGDPILTLIGKIFVHNVISKALWTSFSMKPFPGTNQGKRYLKERTLSSVYTGNSNNYHKWKLKHKSWFSKMLTVPRSGDVERH